MIKQIGKFSAGIFYMQIPLLKYFSYIFLPVKKQTIFGTLFIDIISYFIRLIESKVLFKTKLKDLFK